MEQSSPLLGRRRFMQVAPALVALAALSACRSDLGADQASARTTEPPTLNPSQWLAANRAMFGPRGDDLARLAAMSADAIVEEQLAYERLDTSPAEQRIDAVDGLRDRLNADPAALADDKRRDIYLDLSQATLLRAVYSGAQLYELMVDFWSNHFNIFFQKNADAFLKTTDDREVIRPHAMGKFRDLLSASAHSPAMLIYLDNQTNRKGSPNENYARELMELHTLGVNGGYTQADVHEVARALTGWSVQPPRTKANAAPQPDAGRFIFRPRQHDNDAKRILGIDFAPNGGKADGERVLELLTQHPSTATFISLKLARRFIADSPDPNVVALGAKAFRQSDGDIKATLSALLHSDAFRLSSGQKMKRPFEMIVSALRAVQAETDGNKPIAAALREMGQPLFAWASPNGYPDVAAAWTGSSALLARWNFGFALGANGHKGTRVALSPALTLNDLAARLLGAALPSSIQQTMQPFAKDLPALMGLLLASPQFQVRG